MQISEFHSAEDEITFITELFHNSVYTDRDEFCKQYIPFDLAQAIVFSDDTVMDDYFNTHGLPLEAIEQHMSPKMSDFAYKLAMNVPNLATELYDALTYYRTAGRI